MTELTKKTEKIRATDERVERASRTLCAELLNHIRSRPVQEVILLHATAIEDCSDEELSLETINRWQEMITRRAVNRLQDQLNDEFPRVRD